MLSHRRAFLSPSLLDRSQITMKVIQNVSGTMPFPPEQLPMQRLEKKSTTRPNLP